MSDPDVDEDETVIPDADTLEIEADIEPEDEAAFLDERKKRATTLPACSTSTPRMRTRSEDAGRRSCICDGRRIGSRALRGTPIPRIGSGP
jgi:hypothetical protein